MASARVAFVIALVLALAGGSRVLAFHQEWHAFMSQYGRQYDSDAEHDARYAVFRDNLARIAAHNAEADLGRHTYRLAVNQFADLTHDEYRARMKLRAGMAPSAHRLFRRAENSTSVPDTVDWRTKGMVTPVKDQGQCGSCWSFSATGSMEGAYALATSTSDPTQRFNKKHLLSFSEQELVDCVDDGAFNCFTGGIYTDAFEFVIANGTVLEADYAYVNGVNSTPEKCRLSSIGRHIKPFSNFVQLVSGDEKALQRASSQHPGVSVAIDASWQSFQFYSSGVYKEDQCSSDDLDHAVLVVGYGTDPVGGDYWLVKNSWSATWGEQGYIRMARNRDNMCGIATQPAYILAETTIQPDSDLYVSVM